MALLSAAYECIWLNCIL